MSGLTKGSFGGSRRFGSMTYSSLPLKIVYFLVWDSLSHFLLVSLAVLQICHDLFATEPLPLLISPWAIVCWVTVYIYKQVCETSILPLRVYHFKLLMKVSFEIKQVNNKFYPFHKASIRQMHVINFHHRAENGQLCVVIETYTFRNWKGLGRSCNPAFALATPFYLGRIPPA